MTNLKLGYRFDKQWQVTLDVLNLFDKKANDIEYWGSACSRSEDPTVAAVPTPPNPRASTVA